MFSHNSSELLVYNIRQSPHRFHFLMVVRSGDHIMIIINYVAFLIRNWSHVFLLFIWRTTYAHKTRTKYLERIYLVLLVLVLLVVVGATSSKSLKLRRFKSDREVIISRWWPWRPFMHAEKCRRLAIVNVKRICPRL